MLKKIISIAASAAVVASVLMASPAHANQSISGLGSSFAGNAMSECTSLYTKNTATYTPDSSGNGRSGFTAGTLDYALSDAIYSSGFPGGTYNTIPLFGGPIAFVYTAAGVGDGLNLTPAIISGILKGEITKWNNPDIRAINPKVKLPAKALIKVRYRSDSSGTSENLSEYLSETVPNAGWTKNSTLANANTLVTARALGVSKSAGMAAAVEDTLNTFGYMDLSDALQVDVGIAKLKNVAGAFVAPTSSSAAKFLNAQTPATSGSDAVKGTVNLDFTRSISGAYQASLLVYGIAPRFVPSGTVKVSTNLKKLAVKDFFSYIVGSCLPSKAATLGYVALGGALKTSVTNQIKTIG
jgi:phosphate transport system substrate-binding protein